MQSFKIGTHFFLFLGVASGELPKLSDFWTSSISERFFVAAVQLSLLWLNDFSKFAIFCSISSNICWSSSSVRLSDHDPKMEESLSGTWYQRSHSIEICKNRFLLAVKRGYHCESCNSGATKRVTILELLLKKMMSWSHRISLEDQEIMVRILGQGRSSILYIRAGAGAEVPRKTDSRSWSFTSKREKLMLGLPYDFPSFFRLCVKLLIFQKLFEQLSNKIFSKFQYFLW